MSPHATRPVPTRKGTTLRNEPRSHHRDALPAGPPRRRPAFAPAADVIGSELDLRLTGSHVVHALTPGFCDAASVYLLERWVLEENAYPSVDPPQIEARRLAVRVGAEAPESWDGVLPVGEVVVFPARLRTHAPSPPGTRRCSTGWTSTPPIGCWPLPAGTRSG